jgi:hypothetical protein
MTRAQLVVRIAFLAAPVVATALLASSCGVGELDLAGHACPCAAGFLCDGTRNVCVSAADLAVDGSTPPVDTDAGVAPCLGDSCTCTTNSDCKDPQYAKCIDGKCAQCTSSPDTCGVGRYCLASHLCAPGCKSSSECAALSPTAPFCNVTRHQCVTCSVDTDCKNAQKCSPAGACVDACTGNMCTGGKVCCGGLCLDTTNDPLNCNACGNACTGAQTECCAGTCTDPLTTATDCGTCGTVCSSLNGAPACNAGSCKWTCNAGYNHCAVGNTGCETSTSANTTQCGSCTTNCTTNVVHANGVACVASVCTYATCTTGYSDCDAKKYNGCECVTPACGGPNQICCAGNVCVPGQLCEVAPPGDGKCH